MGNQLYMESCHEFLILLKGGKFYLAIFNLYYVSERNISILLCICPLIAIMVDQKEKFASAGIAVEFLEEAQTINAASLRAINGNVQLVFSSPENLKEY